MALVDLDEREPVKLLDQIQTVDEQEPDRERSKFTSSLQLLTEGEEDILRDNLDQRRSSSVAGIRMKSSLDL